MTNAIAHNNVEKISQLQLGMTQEEVYDIMRYPSTEDQIFTDDGCYEIWFYVTKSNILDQNQYVARNLTPLIFKDKIFVGMGRAYYQHLVQKSQQPQMVTPEKTPIELRPNSNDKRENIPLEKVLTPSKTPSQKESAVPKQSKKTTLNMLSMCSKPRRTESSIESDAEEPKNKDQNHPENDSSEPVLDEEDREMLDLERQENFNDW